MTLKFSKIDKLLQLFSSSDDEQLDELNEDEKNCFEEVKTNNVPKHYNISNKNRNKQAPAVKASIEKSARKQSKISNGTTRIDIKLIELENKPIMIKDSDSEVERSNKQSFVNLELRDNKLIKLSLSNTRIRKKKLKKKSKFKEKQQNLSDDSANKKDESGNMKQITENCENENICKTIRTRKNRAQVKRNLRCKECNQRMKNEQLHMLHMQIHDNRTETECILCNKQFENINQVLEHYGSFDKNKEDEHYIKFRPFPCHLCDFRYKNRKHLTDHLDIHAGQGKYLCPVCGKRFFKGFNMQIHLKVHEKAYHSCEKCSKNFRNIREYQAHQRNIHGENNITCPICNRPFSRRNNMKKHMETHGRVYNQCVLCNTNFEFRRDYNQHMREVHNRIKKYTCTICGKVFLLHCKLTRHLETHSRIKDNCSICDKEFRNRRDYNAHMRNVHAIKYDIPNKENKNDNCSKMQFKIIHDVQVSQNVDTLNGGINDDLKINIKIDINNTNQGFDGYYF